MRCALLKRKSDIGSMLALRLSLTFKTMVPGGERTSWFRRNCAPVRQSFEARISRCQAIAPAHSRAEEDRSVE
jgi:hypothetical protein